jgi:hypothetical protein
MAVSRSSIFSRDCACRALLALAEAVDEALQMRLAPA